MKALIQTKSNYQNLNGKWIDIIQFCGSIVFCEFIDTNGELKRSDFMLKEIISIKQF
jgi:hypothetical protein